VKRVTPYIVLGLVGLVVGTASVLALRHFGTIGPREPQVDVGGMILKSVSELLKITVLEMPVVSDASHPTEFRRAKGCVVDIFCAGSYWSVFDWRATVRMSYNLAAVSTSKKSGLPLLVHVHTNEWKLHLPSVAVDVELQAEHVNFRTRRVGALLSAQQAATWEQDLFHATRKYLGECFGRNSALRQRAQDALATQLQNALLPLLSEYNGQLTFLFADESGEPLSVRSLKRGAGDGEAGGDGSFSPPNCDRLLLALNSL
jgi:hypothetical protein